MHLLLPCSGPAPKKSEAVFLPSTPPEPHHALKPSTLTSDIALSSIYLSTMNLMLALLNVSIRESVRFHLHLHVLLLHERNVLHSVNVNMLRKAGLYIIPTLS